MTSLAMASCSVLIRDVCQVTVTLFDCVKLPSQLNLPIENSEVVRSVRVASKIRSPSALTAMKVPSCVLDHGAIDRNEDALPRSG